MWLSFLAKLGEDGFASGTYYYEVGKASLNWRIESFSYLTFRFFIISFKIYVQII